MKDGDWAFVIVAYAGLVAIILFALALGMWLGR